MPPAQYATKQFPSSASPLFRQAAKFMKHTCIITFCRLSAAKLYLHAFCSRAVSLVNGAQDRVITPHFLLALISRSHSGAMKSHQIAFSKAPTIIKILPKAINKSLEFVTPELTVIYLELINRAQEIEEHLKNFNELKVAHMDQIQQMHAQLIRCKGVKFSKDHLAKYDQLFKAFIGTFKDIRRETLRQAGMNICK